MKENPSMKKNISRVRVAVAALIGGVMLLGATVIHVIDQVLIPPTVDVSKL
jgi:uncharacterized surface protein with fasciclin (FAS1) repeats